MLGRIVDALAGLVQNALPNATVRAGPPRDTGEGGPLEVAIWLYRISPDAVNNMAVHDSSRAFVPHKLTASLHYLLVAGGGPERDAHDAIGLLWKAMHHHALLGGEESGSSGVDLAVEILDQEALAGLWATLALPMRPSVAIIARGVEP